LQALNRQRRETGKEFPYKKQVVGKNMRWERFAGNGKEKQRRGAKMEGEEISLPGIFSQRIIKTSRTTMMIRQ